MRTTLDIADDVLLAAKEAARRDKRSVGDVVSDLARRALQDEGLPRAKRPASARARHRLSALGIEPLPKRGGIVSNEAIDRLRDDGIY